jgi:hypothetical protein
MIAIAVVFGVLGLMLGFAVGSIVEARKWRLPRPRKPGDLW